MTRDTADLGADLEQAQLREVVWSALAGLTASEREIIELNLGHELDGADLADALGVPRNQAHAMASRARAHFEAALGVLLVARSGRDACPELAGMLVGWDGRLTVLLRKRVGRHIRRCRVCGDRQRRELSPVALLSALPAALRHQVLRPYLGRLTRGRSPAAGGRAAGGPARARGLSPSSGPAVPRPPAPPGARDGVRAGRRGRRRGRDRRGRPGGGGLLHHPGPAQLPGASPTLPSTGVPPRAGSPSVPASGAGGAGDGAASPGPKVLRSGSAGASTAPAAPGGTPAPATTSAAPAPAISAVAAGTLTVSPASLGLKLSLAGLWTGTLTLTAHGGPVSAYHVAVPVPLLQDLTLSQVSGSLAAGQSVRITVTAARGALFSTALLTVSPGSLSVPVTYNLLG